MADIRAMLQAAAGAAGGGGGWDLANAAYNGTPINFFSVVSEVTSIDGVVFKSDGTKMYIVNTTNDAVYEYDLSSAWDISTASYLQNFSVAAQEANPRGLFFKPDGTKMYVVGSTGDAVYEYDLSTAWNVSTASYLQNFSVASQETSPLGVFFKTDGTKMYIVGSSGDDVNQYDLSSAWDISTASYVQNFSVASQDTTPSDLFFKSDGTKMYVVGTGSDNVNEYSLSSAWDISTASYVQNFSVASQNTTPTGVFFKDDGTKMYVAGSTSPASIYSYDLSSAFNISTASFTYPATDYFSVASQEITPGALFFKPDGTKMYVIGEAGDDVNEYSLSSAWDITSASYVQAFSIAAQEAAPSGLFFKDDGTKMYVCGISGDDVNEYSLSTAWNISTASYVQNFSVASQDDQPRDVFFKSDGTKMYMIGSGNGNVNEYDLSSAWDISTASYNQNFSVASQESGPQGLFFKPDGTKMYVIGTSGDDVNEYDLSSAWNVSTASFVQSFFVGFQEALPSGLAFKTNGTKLYILGTSSDAIWSFDL